MGNAPDRDLISLAKLAPTSILESYAAGSNVFSRAIAMQKSLKLYYVLDKVVKIAYAIEGAYYGIQGISSLGRMSSALRAAEEGSGNFGIGNLTNNEAMIVGRKWVGKDFRRSSRDPNIWISEDGLRQFRAPSYKPKLGIQQANFQSRVTNRGIYTNNGHANIIASPKTLKYESRNQKYC